MKTKLRTRIPGMTLAVMLALTVGQALVVEPEARAADGGKLEGNWLMESTPVDCATGDPLPPPTDPPAAAPAPAPASPLVGMMAPNGVSSAPRIRLHRRAVIAARKNATR